MKNLKFLLPLFICPQCKEGKITNDGCSESLYCEACAQQYFTSYGRPILIRTDNDIFLIEDYRSAPLSVNKTFSKRLAVVVPKASVNLSRDRVLLRAKKMLAEMPMASVLIVGSGAQRSKMEKLLGADKSTRVVYSDIDTAADVDLFCDGHDLPFAASSFDMVVTTAVLEHVLYPEKVAAEIARVLKVGGLLYSEMPFMQQVHEGAYDFTRYTLSGHRRLFNKFEEVESGLVAGPATALAWAIENFALSFFSKNLMRIFVKVFIRFCFFWLKYLDYFLCRKPAAMDGAACTYLLGRKGNIFVADSRIIKTYVGAKVLRHV